MVENSKLEAKDIKVKLLFVMIDGLGDLNYKSLNGNILSIQVYINLNFINF